MGYPITFFETSAYIVKEELVTEQFLDKVHNSTFAIDNTKNIKRKPIIILTFKDSISSLKLKNTTTNVEVNIIQDFTIGQQIQIEYDAVYQGNSEINSNYNGILVLKENSINTFQVELIPDLSVGIDIEVIYNKYPEEYEEFIYLEDVKIVETNSLRRISGGIGNKIAKGYEVEETNYNFTIGQLWHKSSLFNIDNDSYYRIRFKTDDDIGGIESQDLYLCGCKFDNHEISGRRGGFYSENLTGVAINLF